MAWTHRGVFWLESILQSDNFFGLRAAHAVLDDKLDLLAGRQVPKALVADGRVVNKDLTALFGLNVSKTLGAVKPADGAFDSQVTHDAAPLGQMKKPPMPNVRLAAMVTL
jgi:hypothetical protein